MPEELKIIESKVAEHEVAIQLLQRQHETFESTSIEFLRKSAREEESIHHRLDSMIKDIHSIPEMVSSKLQECRADMRSEVDKAYPRRHEVVTPKALMMAAGLLAVVLVAGMTTTMLVWDKIDTSSHAEHSHDSGRN